MKVSVTVEQKIVDGVAQEKEYHVKILYNNRPFTTNVLYLMTNLTAPEAQELAEKLQAEVSKALSI